MRTGRRKSGIHSITHVVVIGAIGIIALAFGWLALNTNTEGRSKAASSEKVYKTWEFKGTTDGWVGETGTKLKPTANALLVTFPEDITASLLHNTVKTTLPYGNKYLKIRLSLGLGDAVLGITDNRGNTIDEVSDESPEPGFVESSVGSGIVDSDQMPVCEGPGCLSPEEINNAQPIGWPNPDQKCSLRPSCLDKPPYCRIDEPVGGWCPPSTTPCTPPPPCLYTAPYCKLEPPPGNWCPFPTSRPPTPIEGSTTFTLTILYQLTGKTTWEKPVVKTGLASKGSYADYAMFLSAINPLSVSKLKIQVSKVGYQGIKSDVISNYLLNIDRVWLTGSEVKPTAKPTCTPEPPCLYTPPYCLIDVNTPIGGWCPRVTPTPTRRPTPTPTLLPIVPNDDNPEMFYEAPRSERTQKTKKKDNKHWTCKVFPNRSWCQ